jgi:hypothetical protein
LLVSDAPVTRSVIVIRGPGARVVTDDEKGVLTVCVAQRQHDVERDAREIGSRHGTLPP